MEEFARCPGCYLRTNVGVMNPYLAETIARQRQEEIARNARFDYQATRPERRSRVPRVSWQLVRHLPVAHT